MMIKITKGLLVEYTERSPRLELLFEFNPASFSRSRQITFASNDTPGNESGYDFNSAGETPRISQGVAVNNEEISIDILLDATERMANNDAIANQYGISPELDTLKSMLEPKAQGPDGQQTLASLGQGEDSGFSRDVFSSVFLFVWGDQMLPVFLTSIGVEETAHLPSLVPYRANVSIAMKVIESNNPYYIAEKSRQQNNASRYNSQSGYSVTIP